MNDDIVAGDLGFNNPVNNDSVASDIVLDDLVASDLVFDRLPTEVIELIAV